MGLLAKLFNDFSDQDFKVAHDLVTIAMADSEISEAERKDAGTTLLTENSLLNNEFQAMGIDFETILMDEREKAIRRLLEK